MLTRRQFAGSLAAASVLSAADKPMPTRRLGRINFQASMLGLGSQHLGLPSLTQENATRVVAEAIELGVNYIDTAPTYNFSEERLGHALKGRRDKVFLVSKVETSASSDVLYQIHDSLHKLQTDHLDCVHIHNVGREDRYPTMKQLLAADGTLGGLIQAKKQGLIRHIGATCHMRPARAVPVLETGEIELFMCSINFVERHIYKFEEIVLPETRRRNIAAVGMKVLGGPTREGARLMSAEDYQATLRYAWSVPGLAVVNLGIRTPEELRKAVAAAKSFEALQPAELTALLDRGKPVAAQWGPLRGPVA